MSNNIAEWDDAQLSAHENIRRSFHKALPAMLAGRAEPRAYAPNGDLQVWDRGPVRQFRFDPAQIVDAVCVSAGIEIELFYSENRQRRIVRSRQMAAYIMHEMRPVMSQSELAAEVGYTDPSTVHYSLKMAAKELLDPSSTGYRIYHRAKRELMAR